MAARKPGAKRGPKRGRPAPARTARPALGNDPFERGAAVRAQPPAAAATARDSSSPAPEGAAGSPPPFAPTIPRLSGAREQDAAHPTATTPPGPSFTVAAVEAVRQRLDAVEQRLESAAGGAAERMRDLARQDAAGQLARDLGQALSGLLPALRERLAGLAQLRALLSGPGELDFFGMDRELAARAAPALDFLYASWWRVEVRDVERVPSEGPVIVVANHGGALAWDALVLRLALAREHPARRDLRPLLDDHAMKAPIFGSAAARLGAVPATPENALRLLGAGTAVAVFPEGSRSAGRPWSQRYRVERFGRGGFARIALRTGAAVVPCAIVGSEETSAPFARPGWLAERLGIPFLGSSTALPLAPLAILPLPSRWSLRFGDPIPLGPRDPSAADDQARVLTVTERTRASLQQLLDEDVAARRSVYL
jgi:1-acyl-sn-glycerol-3-phosphate acyltransferase